MTLKNSMLKLTLGPASRTALATRTCNPPPPVASSSSAMLKVLIYLLGDVATTKIHVHHKKLPRVALFFFRETARNSVFSPPMQLTRRFTLLALLDIVELTHLIIVTARPTGRASIPVSVVLEPRESACRPTGRLRCNRTGSYAHST